jgi:hypothetical protein
MKNHYLTLILLCVVSGSGNVRAAMSGGVVAWGNDEYGQSTVSNHLNNVTAIAAGAQHVVALIGTARQPLPYLAMIRFATRTMLTSPAPAFSRRFSLACLVATGLFRPINFCVRMWNHEVPAVSER